MPYLKQVNPVDLVVHPLHLQIFGADAHDQHFVDDVAAHGVESAPDVIERNGRLVVIKGRRRRAAAIAAGILEIEVRVRDDLTDDKEAELELIRDNDPKLRRDLPPDTLARMATAVVERLKSQGSAAKELGVSRKTVNQMVTTQKKIEALREEGDHAEANRISAALNVSVAKGHKAATAGPDPAPPGRPRKQLSVGERVQARRAILVKAEKLLDQISTMMGSAAKEDGGISEESKAASLAYSAFAQEIIKWKKKS